VNTNAVYVDDVQEFEVSTTIAAPAALAFDLARDMSVHGASTGRGRERAVAGVTSGLIGPGEQVTFRATHFGVPFTLTSRVTGFDRPRSFVDEQVSGPFRSWHHRHEFRPAPTGTVMTDTVRLTAPFGPLGRLAERLVLVRYMRNLIVARGGWLAAEAERRRVEGGGAWPAS
jgi:ligand-binding SRPBCC domain-containing protein